MHFRKIDPATGIFIEDAIFDAAPVLADGTPDPTYIAMPCPGGFYWPRWDGEKWVEGGTAQEPTPQAPTIEERLDGVEQGLDEVVTILEGIV